ncbi:BRO family protein [Methylovulum psychrotolerans]|uniref:Bro-N domain-containing protein n=1 Tax=Methylovulum psychrotolerans TaxID=1704499 RepID=A0A2S5CGF9_9GAMM|nr:hypothetical protein AADEFJLK_04330 [Methylovulum psychrotolerans]
MPAGYPCNSDLTPSDYVPAAQLVRWLTVVSKFLTETIMNTSNFSLTANPFFFSLSAVRTALDADNNPWFCAKDVCAVLGIEWTGHTLDNMPESWKGVVKLTTPSAHDGRGGGS